MTNSASCAHPPHVLRSLSLLAFGKDTQDTSAGTQLRPMNSAEHSGKAMTIDRKTIDILSAVTTATITTTLLKHGLRNLWMRHVRPLRPGSPRLVGRAFTLRFVPARDDLATPASWASPRSTRAAIEAMPEGCIAVVDALGITDAGIFGDILCARMRKRGV